MLDTINKNNYKTENININNNNLKLKELKNMGKIYNISEDEELKRYEMNQQMMKFNDNNPEFIKFKETVKVWLELDDDIKTLRKAVSERNKKKKELTPNILEYMQRNKIFNLNTQSGKLRCRKSIRTRAFNNKTLKSKLIDYFKDISKGSKVAEYLVSNKEKIENMTLSRTVYRKKNKINELNIKN